MRDQPSDSPDPSALAGSLLLAHPTLQDAHFRRTVVLLSAHDAEGAMGIVLNRPLGRKLSQLHTEFALGPLASVPLYEGGPVQPDRLLLCAWRPHTDGDGFQLFFGIEAEKAIELQADDTVQLRAFLGYSGWSGGQLENELAQNVWVVSPLLANILEMKPDVSLWRGILGGVNHEWKLIVDAPDDPSVN